MNKANLRLLTGLYPLTEFLRSNAEGLGLWIIIGGPMHEVAFINFVVGWSNEAAGWNYGNCQRECLISSAAS